MYIISFVFMFIRFNLISVFVSLSDLMSYVFEISKLHNNPHSFVDRIRLLLINDNENPTIIDNINSQCSMFDQ